MMTIIQWKRSLSVGIQEIDEQHKKLLGYLNDLYDALQKRKEKQILEPIFHNLEEYARYHFELEESYFKKFNYPEKEEHIKEHEYYIRRLAELKRQIHNNTAYMEDLFLFLAEWLMHHIREVDHKYSDFFHEHGLH